VTGNLISELRGDLDALRRIGGEIREAAEAVRGRPGDSLALDALAARLHWFYGCIEDMAYRVSVHINGEVPGGPHGHKELLERTGVEVPGKRRALWRKASIEDLHELRKFRHFFRTRYAVQLDRQKLLVVADLSLRTLPALEDDVQGFLAGLASGPC
jgi:hypothetical protein